MAFRTWTNEELDRGLALTFDCDAGRGLTVRLYLRKLLATLWREGEGFDGKRPFGNSGWQYDVYKPLVEAKLMSGTIDKDGYLFEVSNAEGCDLVLAMIRRALP